MSNLSNLLPEPLTRSELCNWVDEAGERVGVPDDWVLPSRGDVASLSREGVAFVSTHRLPKAADIIGVGPEMPVAELEKIVLGLGEAAILGQDRLLVGVAAPQIGEPYQIFLANTTPWDKNAGLTLFVNPEVTGAGESVCFGIETCFSCMHVYGIVPRPEITQVNAVDLNFTSFNISGIEDTPTSIAGRVLWHESDHLRRMFFPDRVIAAQEAGTMDENTLSWVHREQAGVYRDYAACLKQELTANDFTGPSTPWVDVLPAKQWLSIREGRIMLPSRV